MTVVNPKSISGINSITTGSGSDDLLTIHTNNGTERLRIDSTGATKIVTGIVTTLTATTGIVTSLTATTLTSTTGIVTSLTATTGDIITLRTPTGIATHFTADKISLPDSSDGSLCVGVGSDMKLYHDGSHSWIDNTNGNLYVRGTDIRFLGTNNDNIIKGLHDGAVDLFYDGTTRLSTTGNGADIFGSGASSAYLKLINTSASSNNSHQFTVDGYNAANSYWNKIQIDASEVLLKTYTGTRATLTNTAFTLASGTNLVSESSSSGDYVRVYAGSGTGKWDIYGNGANLRFSDNDSAGSVVFDRNIQMASGKGIDFSATGDGSGSMANELLDDYEEGTWTASISGGSFITTNAAYYTKIGRQVFWMLHCRPTFAQNDNAAYQIYGLPYTSANATENYGWTGNVVYTGGANSTVIANIRPLVQKNDTYVYFHTVGQGSATRVDNVLIRTTMLNNDFLMGGHYMTAT